MISRLRPVVRRSQSSEVFIMSLYEYSEFIPARRLSEMSSGDISTSLTDHFVTEPLKRHGEKTELSPVLGVCQSTSHFLFLGF